MSNQNAVPTASCRHLSIRHAIQTGSSQLSLQKVWTCTAYHPAPIETLSISGRQDVNLAAYKCTQCHEWTWRSALDLARIGLYPGNYDNLDRNRTYVHEKVLQQLALRKHENPGGGTGGFGRELDARSIAHNTVRERLSTYM